MASSEAGGAYGACHGPHAMQLPLSIEDGGNKGADTLRDFANEASTLAGMIDLP